MFFPLRSNAGWFISREGKEDLEGVIKNYIILFDKIVFQDGRYYCSIGEKTSVDSFIPANFKDLKREKIKDFIPGKERFSLKINSTGSADQSTLFEEEVKFRFEADFYAILDEAGLAKEGYIDWMGGDLNQDGKKLSKELAKKDVSQKNIKKPFPGNLLVSQKILEALYIDSLISESLQLPFCVDYRFKPILLWKNSQIKKLLYPTLQEVFYNIWLSYSFPDWSKLSWDEVHKARESSAGIEFRKMISRVIDKVKKNLEDFKDPKELESLVSTEFTKELIEELEKRITTPKKTLLNLIPNLLPFGYGTLISTSQEVGKMIKEKSSWVSFLVKQ